MSTKTYPLVNASSATLLKQQEQIANLLIQVEKAKTRIWASYFIVALSVYENHYERIKEILDALIRAHQRGVEVRMIVDDFRNIQDNFSVNNIAAKYLINKGVPVKRYQSDSKQSSHCKEWIIDDNIQITGSGNLTVGGLLRNNEMSLMVTSRDLNKLLSSRYQYLWEDAQTIV